MSTEQFEKEQAAPHEPRTLTPSLSRRTGEGAPATARVGEGECARFKVPMRIKPLNVNAPHEPPR